MSEQELKHLGKQSQDPVEQLEAIEWGDASPPPTLVRLDCSEFTSHCPVTKQPDFAEIRIEYVPDAHIVETKSLKLWLWRFRDEAKFNERIVGEIACDFYKQIKPHWVGVTGFFNPRGGISVTSASEYGERP